MTVTKFDHTAGHFAKTRGLPSQIADQVASVVDEVLGKRHNVLDVGIGPGRIAMPLIARGIQLTGIDVSFQMLYRLKSSLHRATSSLSLAQGNATLLPFTRNSFDAAITIHVLTILAGWRAALSEIRRVLKPEGVLFVGYEWRPPDSPGQILLRKWQEMIRAEGMDIEQAGGQDIEEIQDVLTGEGAQLEIRETGNWKTERTLSQHLEAIEHRTWSRSSDIPKEFYTSLMRKITRYAIEEFGDLKDGIPIPRKFVWMIFKWEI